MSGRNRFHTAREQLLVVRRRPVAMRNYCNASSTTAAGVRGGRRRGEGVNIVELLYTSETIWSP